MKANIKILAVCGCGVGTSLILRMNLEQVLKNNDITAEVEHNDGTSAVGIITDIVVTSREIAGQIESNFDVPVIVIDNFMDLNEIEEKCVGVIKSM